MSPRSHLSMAEAHSKPDLLQAKAGRFSIVYLPAKERDKLMIMTFKLEQSSPKSGTLSMSLLQEAMQ